MNSGHLDVQETHCYGEIHKNHVFLMCFCLCGCSNCKSHDSRVFWCVCVCLFKMVEKTVDERNPAADFSDEIDPGSQRLLR